MSIDIITIPGGHNDEHGYCAQLIQLSDYRDLEYRRDQLREILVAWQEAFDALFAQCCSNGIKDAWGRPVNCALLNAVAARTNAELVRSK